MDITKNGWNLDICDKRQIVIEKMGVAGKTSTIHVGFKWGVFEGNSIEFN